jgi:hypothetical protein
MALRQVRQSSLGGIIRVGKGLSAGDGQTGHGWSRLPQGVRCGFLILQAEAVGQPAFISGEVEKILGRPAHLR